MLFRTQNKCVPLVRIEKINEDATLALWKISESKQELMAMLGNHLHDSSRPENPAENVGVHWFASRFLLQHLFDADAIHIHKNEYNKPTLQIDETPYFISISHSGKYAAVMVSKQCEVGIDIEKTDERIHRISHKFLNEDETIFATSAAQKILIWSAKETMYKIYGQKELDFREHLNVNYFDVKESGNFFGIVKKNNLQLDLEINYECIDDYVMTWSRLQKIN